MFTIIKEFHFSASHVLTGLPEGHQCGRLHGHNYIVKIELASEHLDARGFVRDYGELKLFREYLDRQFEHRHLNDIMAMPTAENMAVMFYAFCILQWDECAAVHVSETPQTWATYRPTTPWEKGAASAFFRAEDHK